MVLNKPHGPLNNNTPTSYLSTFCDIVRRDGILHFYALLTGLRGQTSDRGTDDQATRNVSFRDPS